MAMRANQWVETLVSQKVTTKNVLKKLHTQQVSVYNCEWNVNVLIGRDGIRH